MSEKVIQLFPDHPEKPTEHLAGEMFCLGCDYHWFGILPVGTVRDIECPACHCNKGHVRYEAMRDDDHWCCGWGNGYFCITQKTIYCPNCGVTHKPFD